MMMNTFTGFITLILLTLLLSRLFIRSFFKLLFLISKSHTISVWFYAIFFLPGTIIHEISHLLVAEILRVKTGPMTLLPKFDPKKKQTQLGSLAIAQVDPFRRTLIGIAPFILGMTLIYLIVNYFDLKFILDLANIVKFYFIFVTANSMISSKKDLEAAIVPLVIITFIIFVYFRSGMPYFELIKKNSLPIINKINTSLIIVVIIDFSLITITKISTYLLEKILRRKVEAP
jgi:hypothetical protein